MHLYGVIRHVEATLCCTNGSESLKYLSHVSVCPFLLTALFSAVCFVTKILFIWSMRHTDTPETYANVKTCTKAENPASCMMYSHMNSWSWTDVHSILFRTQHSSAPPTSVPASAAARSELTGVLDHHHDGVTLSPTSPLCLGTNCRSQEVTLSILCLLLHLTPH